MNFEHVLSEAQARIDSTPDLAALDQVRVAYLGKSGSITALLKELGGLAPEERKLRGAEVNRLRDALSQALTLRKATLDAQALAAKLERERIDVSLPGRQIGVGGLHPITRAMDRIVGIFNRKSVV